MSVTGWFPSKVKPVRIGWYEVQLRAYLPATILRLYWDGKHWSWGPYYAASFPILPGDKWRGSKVPWNG